MGKYKICPACGTHNLPSLLECQACETDLAGARLMDDEEPAAQTPPEEPAGEMVRVCESCGTRNPAAARKCEHCGEDISDVIPVQAEETAQAEAPLRCILSSLDGQYAFEVPEGETTLGRSHAMGEALSAKRYVSRAQAKLLRQDGKVTLENLSKTNPTFVNNVPVTAPVALSDGDELGLGGCVVGGTRQDGAAYFLVRIGRCI